MQGPGSWPKRLLGHPPELVFRDHHLHRRAFAIFVTDRGWHGLAEVGIEIVIVCAGDPAFQVVEMTGRDWAISVIVGPGAIMRLIPNGIFEVGFVKMKLMRDRNELPTVN